MSIPHKLASVLCTLLFAASLAACDNRLTSENYDKLEMGMHYNDVVDVLGAPSECNDVLSIKQCSWGDERRSISVSFVSNQVVFFAGENIR